MKQSTSHLIIRWLGAAAIGVSLGLAILKLSSSLPLIENRTDSTALSETDDTTLGKAIKPKTDFHRGLAGIYALAEGREAFAARMLLANAAERSLDVQYYIWRNDMSGVLLFDALDRAADRGVRVRLLLDDNGTSGLDDILADLDAHPNIEVRLFNPFVIRSSRVISYIIDFSRLNRRMHNKSFTADSQVTIVGGRNVGDEYFDATENAAFVDLDVMAVGPVVQDVSKEFDRYWASESAFPVDRLLSAKSPGQRSALRLAMHRVERTPAAAAYSAAVRASPFTRELVQGSLSLDWAPARLVSDDPAKGLGRSSRDVTLPAKLKEALGEPTTSLDLVSPYFVPTVAGVSWFTALAAEGTQVSVWTNSLEATDVAAVHAGYAKRRKALLAAGVRLFESRRQSAGTRDGSGRGVRSSASSLHAKTFSVDGSRVFVGSFNFDPRSLHLNTEMGLVIESRGLAQRIATAFETRIPLSAYEVRLSDTSDLYWLVRQDGAIYRRDTEPGSTYWERLGIRVLSLLPIEWLL